MQEGQEVEATEPIIFGAWFDSHLDTLPKNFELSWGEFVEQLCAQFRPREDKYGNGGRGPTARGDAPGFSLARFVDRGTSPANRDKAHVDILSGVVFDFDCNYDPDTIFSRVEGLSWAAYTTFSHDPDKQPKWRLVVPLASPIPGNAYKAVRAWVLARLNGNKKTQDQEADKVASSVANFYFGPGCPEAMMEHAEWRVSDGPFLQLPPLSEFRRGVPETRLLGNKIDWTYLHARMITHKDPELRRAFRAAHKGKSFASQGNRDAMLQRMCGALAGWALACEPGDLAFFFAPALMAMEAESPDDPPPDVDNAADKIARAQASMLARSREEVELVVDNKDNSDVVFTDMPAPIADDLVDGWAREAGLADADELRKRLLLRTNHSIWLWRCDQATWAGPLVEGSALILARADLAPFPGVSLWKRGANNSVRQKTLYELFDDYGQVIDKTAMDLRIERATFDVASRTLRLVGAPRRTLEPIFDETVDAWLTALGGDKAEKLKLWIAGLTRHDRPNSVLFIKGDPGIGKGLLVRGLSRVWDTDGATDMRKIAGTFDDGLLRCPLVKVDEGRWNKFVDVTALLRELVTQTSRSINRKHQDLIELEGYLRFVVTANNFNIFANDDHMLTPEDRDAIAERFLEIDPDVEAAQGLLLSMPFEERNALAEGDRIASHALWLRDNVEIPSGSRFIVPGEKNSRFALKIITEDHRWGSWTVEWLARWLSDPPSIERDQSHLVWRGNGRAIVSPEAVVNTFERVLRNKKPPQFLEISNALLSLSTGKLIKFPNERGAKGYDVLVEEIARWSEEKGSGNAEAIRANAHGSVGGGIAVASAGKLLNMRKEEK
ncbi:MAG: hypothetical protein IT381_28305 [Deltaproteobacteria bacterium]|nr:hypothetical protein [Deltaproteobacteria bacterium]